MSIQSEITRITNKRDLALSAVAAKGVTVPAGSTIDDLPDLISMIQQTGASTYTVSASLSNVTSTNNDEEVLAGGSFFMDLTPAPGLAINSVTVLMGGSDITSQVFTPGVGAKTINANGSYDASLEYLSGWSAVTVSVPNSYSASDEGKVVSSGALVSQSSGTCTANGTVDTTLINSLAVNVSQEIEFVEYISTTGSSYFQTGVKANQTSILDGVFYATAAGMPYGCMSSGNSASVSAYFSSGETNNRFGNKAASKLLSFNTLTNIHQEKGSFVVNDSSLDYASVSNFETPYSLRLGAASTATGGVNSMTFAGRIYHFRHIKGGSIAFDGRPAKKNGVYGIYDMVSKTFFQSETATPFSGHDYT